MTRRGRPELPADQVRDAQLGVRVQRDERDMIKAAARAQGVSVSEWARRLLVAAAKRQSTGDVARKSKASKKKRAR